MNETEGYIPFRGHRIWYRRVGPAGESDRLPLLCLHGGPGASWDYFEPLEALAADGRPVVFYDQLGCGNSGVPHDPSLYGVDLYVSEVDAVRQALNLDRVHLLGHSWGGMLALEYTLTHPKGLASLVLSDTGASIPHWMAEGRRLVAALPPDIQAVIHQHEAAGTTGSAEYKDACREYSRRYLSRRMDPRPECLERMAGKPGDEVYALMWGPSEWHVTGTLRDWDVTLRLGEIDVPTLILAGRHDESTPAINDVLQRGIAGSKRVTFEHSGHFPMLEETGAYLQALGAFLEHVEGLA